MIGHTYPYRTPTFICLRMALSRTVFRLLCRRNAAVLATAGRRHYSSADETVGFIGLGNMGAPMAQNLIKSGHKLIMYDVIPTSLEKAVSAGAVKADSPAHVAQQARTIVTMLPAGIHVLECYEGENGILSSVQKDALLLDSSTIEAAVAKKVGASAEKLGANYMDAPVSGGVGAATKGILTFMVGGEETSFHRAKPLLECMGKNVIHCGALGAGQAAKICNNMLLGISMIGTSEALQLGINLGLDPARLTAIINTASGRCWSSDTYNPCPGVMEGVPASNQYQGGFGTSLMSKDLGLALDAASLTKSATPLGSLANQIYRLMCQQGYAGKDFSSVFKFLEKQH